MRIRKSSRSILIIIVMVLVNSVRVYPFSDQTTTERILKENKQFVEFIDICVSNFAEDKKDDFRKACEKQFNADVAYLQSDYKRAYKRVYSSQGDMEKIYREMVKNYYLEDSKAILDKIAPGIIKSKNARARLYLTLGYRDRTVSWVHYTVADASNPKLFSYKIYKFVDAIKMARRAKRFAFLALFESQVTDVKRKIFNELCKNERDEGNVFFSRFVDLKEDEYIKEMGRTYDEFIKSGDDKKEGIKKEESKKEETKKEGEEKKQPDKTASREEGAAGEKTFEKKVEKRVRFRNEGKVARYLLNSEFDKGEDIMRGYIDDFNFKLISATFKVLSATESETAAAERVGFDKLKVHLLDNYSRFSKKSLMGSFAETLKVEDDIPFRQKEGSDGTSVDETHKDESGLTPEKKDEKKVEKKDEKKETGDKKVNPQ